MSGGKLHASVLSFTVCCCLLLAASGRYIIIGRRSDEGSLTGYQVTRVSQEPTPNGSRVRVELSGTLLPHSAYVRADGHNQPYEQLEVQSDGVVEFVSEADRLDVLFLSPRSVQTIYLRPGENSLNEQLLPAVDLNVLEGREVTFENGHDTDVHVNLTVDNEDKDLYLSGKMAMKSKLADHIVRQTYAADGFPFEVLDYSRSESQRTAHFRFNTSSGDVEGLFQITVGMVLNCSSLHPCMLHHYHIYVDVPIFQNDHIGPFPENYIGYLDIYDRETVSTTEMFCSMHNTEGCVVWCMFIGDQPTAVHFVQTDQHALLLTPTVVNSFSNGAFKSAGMAEFWNFENMTANTVVEYQCKCKSGSEEASHTFKLNMVHKAKINGTLSTVTALTNESVEVRCVAEGTPAPRVSFTDPNGANLDDPSSDAYDLIVPEPRGSTSEAVLRIHDPAMVERFGYVVCRAGNTVGPRMQIYHEDTKRLPLSQANVNDIPPEIQYYLNHVVVEQNSGARKRDIFHAWN
ncbi:uncharacterized protein LOC143300284 [Babylonia areolata]|uniref:uncharacterized protein LOC143300284 n=1 Tax=Babylonia areolata TaxID=304850 RepID=UPI003FD15CAA